eukprot:1870115-Amphidinium_carterae.1
MLNAVWLKCITHSALSCQVFYAIEGVDPLRVLLYSEGSLPISQAFEGFSPKHCLQRFAVVGIASHKRLTRACIDRLVKSVIKSTCRKLYTERTVAVGGMEFTSMGSLHEGVAATVTTHSFGSIWVYVARTNRMAIGAAYRIVQTLPSRTSFRWPAFRTTRLELGTPTRTSCSPFIAVHLEQVAHDALAVRE